MKRFALASLLIVLFYSSYSQIMTQDRTSTLDVLPENPEKISKLFADTKMKTVLDSEPSVLCNYTVTFYTTAYYQYKASGAGGEIKSRSGYCLSGVSDNAFQEITDETGRYLMKKLGEFGYSFEDYSKLMQAKGYEKIEEKSSEAGVPFEVSKNVSAKTFSIDKNPIAPAIVGNTVWFKATGSMGANIVTAAFDINFVSFGRDISSGLGVTTAETLVEASVNTRGNLQILTPKLKMGDLKNDAGTFYRHEADGIFDITDEVIDGFYAIKADEAKYKAASIALIKRNIDLWITYMNGLK